MHLSSCTLSSCWSQRKCAVREESKRTAHHKVWIIPAPLRLELESLYGNLFESCPIKKSIQKRISSHAGIYYQDLFSTEIHLAWTKQEFLYSYFLSFRPTVTKISSSRPERKVTKSGDVIPEWSTIRSKNHIFVVTHQRGPVDWSITRWW